VPGIADFELAAKKKSLHDSQRETPRVKTLRQDFQTQFVEGLGKLVKRLKFLDESGAHLGLTRLCGRAAPGQRVVETTPGYSGPHYTLVATLGWQEVTAPWIFEGSINSVAFEAYVRSQLLPTLRRGDILVMDNLSAHTGETIRQLIEAQGVRLEFLPPYSPDFNPIELINIANLTSSETVACKYKLAQLQCEFNRQFPLKQVIPAFSKLGLLWSLTTKGSLGHAIHSLHLPIRLALGGGRQMYRLADRPGLLRASQICAVMTEFPF